MIIAPFVHYHKWPLPSLPGDQYDEGAVHDWCEHMDTLFGMFFPVPNIHALTYSACQGKLVMQ